MHPAVYITMPRQKGPEFHHVIELGPTSHECIHCRKWISGKWQAYGAEVPELQQVAIKILAQPTSACSCERNWSSYGFIHNRMRNRLTRKRAADLV